MWKRVANLIACVPGAGIFLDSWSHEQKVLWAKVCTEHTMDNREFKFFLRNCCWSSCALMATFAVSGTRVLARAENCGLQS